MPDPRTRRSRRTDTRTLILDAATRLLHDRGATALTTRAIADAAGLQAPAIYRQFGDKDGLLDAILEREFTRFVAHRAPTVDGEDPVADLRAAWRRHVAFGLDSPALFLLLVEPGRATRSPAAAAGRDALRRHVHRAAAAGRLRVGEARTTELLWAAATGAVLTILADPPGKRDARVADALYDAVAEATLAGAPVLDAGELARAAITVRAATPELAVLSPGERSLMTEWLDRVAGDVADGAVDHRGG